ncbi:Por secretion system C-terminal sorting domain-containing protein [Robiginitalea myxolifaciens]|uniref:Por secretion system C-terminal sorting domain-containing protein n=1 Tax=Robiginitalea myxolifaciens TaxID=400055 RepID=A0A1I6FWZ1_9FLAO|nr:zinc-dependent metalloprotease family protein [Robiginitalea myxolifaciens]SFR34317.1 Por secretion system C-terminal sorting domain-containing protein [Robiginitalea myxolifaciens]
MKTKLRLVLAFPLLFFCFSLWSQDRGELWDEIAGTMDVPVLGIRDAQGYLLRTADLSRTLESLQGQSTRMITVSFPVGEGSIKTFQVEEYSIMHPDLQARYPQIRSYRGFAIDDPQGRQIRFSLSPQGFQGMLLSASGSGDVFIEQHPDRPGNYILFSRKDRDDPIAWKCETEGATASAKTGTDNPSARLVDDGQLRTYRLAVTTTGEYTEYHGGTVPDALAAINASMTRINAIFERDMALRMELIPETDQIIFTDPGTDPFGGNLSSEAQTTLSANIGASAYDIGHLFHRAGATGNAGGIGTVCVDSQKGGAFSATPNPEGDRFDVDFVAHEMGHQFGANHTWSFQSEGTEVQAEPASGTTIMGYAGITQQNDVADFSDDYFHYYSILQMSSYVTGLSCGTTMNLTNLPPVITSQPDYIIPQGTAFVLEGTASDPDGTDVLTYTWEQIDNGVVTQASFGPENPIGASFRSLPPTTDNARYFPSLERIRSGNLTQQNPGSGSAWETVATIERDLNFALTVRDNAFGGGQVTSDLVRVGVRAAAGPFEMTSQSTSQTFQAGSVQNISWDVAGTSDAPINCQELELWLSTNGGLSFDILIDDALPNIGSATIQLPGTPTNQGRFMLKAKNNIFLAVNAANFTITQQDFVLQANRLTAEVCQPDNGAFAINYQRFGSFTEVVSLSMSGLPAGVNANFSPSSVQANDTDVLLTLTGTGGASPGNYDLVLTGTGGGSEFNLPLSIQLLGGTSTAPVLASPTDGAQDVGLRPNLQWIDNPDITSYTVELAADSGFLTLIAQETLAGNSYQVPELQPETEYFWRVSGTDACGAVPFSQEFRFTTAQVSCKTITATGLPIDISPVGTPTVESRITVPDNGTVADIKVSLDIEHSFLSDLIIKLQSPSGTVVTLVSNSCGSAADLVAVFDNSAAPFVCGSNPAISGMVRPLGSFNAFAGESSQGEWILTIDDTLPADGGQLNSFELELCVEGEFRPDADGDGVFDDGDDLCLGTPAGAEVDAFGCEVFRFASNQFQVEIATESCVGQADGSVAISASSPLNYQATLTGNGINRQENFTQEFTFGNLPAGDYELCIDGNDGTNNFEPSCFQVTISGPEPLGVVAQTLADGSGVALALSGAAAYTVRLNGNTQTLDSRTALLQFEQGMNVLEVEAIPSCAGSFRQEYFYSNKPEIAPNPFVDRLEFFLPWPAEVFTLEIFNAAGSLVFSKELQAIENRGETEVPVLPSGLYVVRVSNQGNTATYKLFRQ